MEKGLLRKKFYIISEGAKMKFVNSFFLYLITLSLLTQFVVLSAYLHSSDTNRENEIRGIREFVNKGMQTTVLITELGFNTTSGSYEIEVFNNLTGVIFDTDLQVFIDGVYTNTAWSVTTLASKKYAIGSIASQWPDGAIVELRRSDLTLLDSLSYGTKGTAPDPLPNESIARVFISGEYSNNWTRCSMPTFGRENSNTVEIESQPEIILNEVLFNPVFEKAFVELYYLGNNLVDFSLTNYYLVCDSVYIINSGMLSTSNRHLVIYNDSFDSNFNLTSEKNNLYLYSHDGRRLDIIGWSSAHEPDKSLARLHDGLGCYNGFLGNYPDVISYNSTCYDDASTLLGGWVFNSNLTPNSVNDNLPQIWTFSQFYSITDDEQLNVTVNVSDADGDDCTIEIGYSNLNATSEISYQLFNNSNNSVSILINPASNNIGNHIFFINVSDGYLWNYSYFEVNIYHKNTPPFFDLNEISPIKNATLGSVYTSDLHAKDNDTIYGDSIFYLVDGPQFFSIDSNGLAVWPVVNVTPLSYVNVNLTAIDNFGLCAYLNYSILILYPQNSQNNPPYFTTDAPNFAYVGQKYEYNANATDPESDNLSYAISSIYPIPANMPTINSETGLIIWYPSIEDANKKFSITIVVSDGHSFAEQHFEVYVGKIPQPPSLYPIPNIVTKEDETVYLNLSLYVSDPDGDELTFYLLGVNTSLFSWTVYNMNLTIIPTKDAFGECSFTLVVFDTIGLKNETPVRLIVLPVNDPPTIFPKIENITLSETQPLVLNLANYENDVDNSHTDLHWQISSNALNVIFEYSIEYTAFSAWLTIRPIRSGQTILTFYLHDLGPQYAMCKVTLTITHVNRAPVIDPLPDLQVRYDRNYTFNFTPYIHDEDNETTELVLSSSTPYATHDISNSMLVTFNFPFSFQNQTIVVFITASDGLASTTSIVNITVKGNIPPIVTSPIQDLFLDEDTNLSSAILLSEHFDDPDMGRAPLLYSCHGNRNIFVFISESGVVDIFPMPDWFGVENVTFRATDLSGAIAEYTVMITVKPVNDAPIVLIPAQQGTEGRNWTVYLDNYIFDIDNTFSQLTITEDSPYVSIFGNTATFSYPLGHRSDFVSFTVSDGINTTVQIVEVTIRPNSPPVIGVIPDISVRFGIDYKFSLLPYVSDPDGDLIQIFNVSSNYIKFGDDIGQIDGVSEFAKQLVIILNYPFEISYERVIITIWDGSLKASAEFNVTVSDNYPPVVTIPIPDLYLREDTPSRGALNLTHYFTDPDGNADLTFTAIGWHFIVISIKGNIVDISPSKDYYGAELVTFRATDTRGAFVEYSITVHVIPVDDPPYFNANFDKTLEVSVGEHLELDLISYVDDIDTNISELTFVSSFPIDKQKKLHIQFSKPGLYSGFVTVRDKTNSVSKTFYINVSARNYAPIYLGGALNLEVILGEVLYIDLNKYFFDVEDDSNLTYTCNTPLITILPNGSAYWKPKKGDSNLYDVRFTATDGLANVTSPPINITIIYKQKEKEETNLIPLIAILSIICASCILAYLLYRKITKTPFVVDDVFLIHSDGRLITHQTRRLRPEVDADIIAGMFVAIQDFIKKSFMQDTEFHLGKLEFGEQKITIDRGKNIFVAVSYSGEDTSELSERMKESLQAIERLYDKKLKNWDGDLLDIKYCKILVQGIFSDKKRKLVKEVAEGKYNEKDLEKLAKGEKVVSREISARDLSERTSKGIISNKDLKNEDTKKKEEPKEEDTDKNKGKKKRK